MRKFLLTMTLVLLSGAAIAQTYTIAPSSGSFNKSGWAASWTSSGLDVQTTFSVNGGANNMDANNTTNFAIYSGLARTSTYVLAVDANYKIISYSFKFASNNGNTITAGDKVMTANTTEQQTFEVTDVNSNSTSFVLAGDNSGISITDFTITVESLGTAYKKVTNPEAFTSGKVYTFESQRGWLMAKEGVDYVYCSGKSGANLTVPAYDNAYCQWVYYATENGKYLYNVAAEKFISYNSSNLNSIPLAATPASGAIEFKASTLTTTYPILLGLESAAINHNLTNNSFTYGALLWSDGWTQAQWAGDQGSAHRVMELFDAETDVLSAIESVVSAFEADNTEAVAELDEAIDKAIAMSAFIGEGVGKYSYTGDGNYQDKFAAIVAFRQSITATNTPTPEEVAAKTAELNALLSSFTLNMPEAGKYYRLKGVSGNYIDATSIYNNPTETVGQMSMKSAETCNLAGTIFYYDSESHLLNYATGTYTKETREIGSIGYAYRSVWNITASPRNNATYALEDTNRENSRNGAHLHDNEGNRADRCASNCGTRHDFTIEEVTVLPVTITSAGYATLYAPVALTVPEGVKAYTVAIEGEWAVLTDVGATIPAETGVVLEAEEGTYNFAITTTDVTVENNALRGTVASEYVTANAYVLGIPEGETEVCFAKAVTEGQAAGTFLNNHHKAYLPAPAGSNAVSYSFRFGEGTTGINEVKGENGNVTVIYDLTGRRVEAITAPGIYVVNGRKVLVK